MTSTTTATSVTDAGFCKCDTTIGYYQDFATWTDAGSGTFNGATALATASAPCVAGAYKPGLDGTTAGSMDECWGTGTTTYADAAALAAASPGCIKGTNGWAVCDTANGWVSPFASGAVSDNTWKGKCVPACYKSGQ